MQRIVMVGIMGNLKKTCGSEIMRCKRFEGGLLSHVSISELP